MTPSEKESWERVRKQGRGRYLLRNIGYAACIFAIVSLVIHTSLLAFGRHVQPVWEMIVTWALFSLCGGTVAGFWRWDENEKAYGMSEDGPPGR